MRTWYLPENAPSAKTTIISAIAATTVIGLGLTNELFPGAINHYVSTRLRNFLSRSQLTVVIEEFDGLAGNQMFDAATVYFGTKVSPSIKRIKVTKPEKEKELAVTVDKNQEIIDVFQGAKFKWVSLSKPIKQLAGSNERPTIVNSRSELRVFEVTFHKKHRDMVLKSYLPYILQKAKEIKLEKKTLKLHTVDYNGTDYWSWTNLDHPSTFDTMAMDPETKKDLLEDLDMFIERKEYYRRVGKAWKRGYLFYGPPGTGKSSLVAAMANYLKFDVYDLDLREVQCNSDLRRLLIGTGNRSILVIEDIDCSVKLENREAEKEAQVGEDDKITLSGLLNFIDGLWSSCGDERIIVFTTNRKDRIDPALLRPGRMDLHIHMSYCTFAGFKVLASNYLGIQDHPLYAEIEELIRWAQATPAKVAGELMKRNNVDVALQGLIKLLQST